VIYTGPWQSAEDIINLALQEDVDVIGISSLAGDHLIVPKLMASLQDADLGHVAVAVGGIIPEREVAQLFSAGVARVYPPGSTRDEIVSSITELAADARRHNLIEDG
jgi:methylmalonyl-CoA mutase C-terminal domain/subunit